MSDGPARPVHPVEVLRVAPDLVDLAAQLVWVAAREREVLRGPTDDSGLVRLLVDAPFDDRQRASFEAGLTALLLEPWARERGVYLREVRERSGARRELGLPIAPAEWTGGPGMVGPFADRDAAEAWRRAAVRAPLAGDVIELDGSWFVDVFTVDDELTLD